MARMQAYSSVVVTDYSDAGQINLYLTSNLPNNVIYDPNQDLYTPDWSDTPLIITPVVAFNGNALDLTATGLSITFQRQEGSGSVTDLTTGENVTQNQLTVSANKLAAVSSKLLTYICNLTYTNPNTNVPLSTQATLTYSLINNATESKDASISGESVFLYDADRELVGEDTIVLTANVSNVTVSQWQYKNIDGEFVAYPTTHNASISVTTLNVLATETAIWNNKKSAVIKLCTSDPNINDIHEVFKIYDGVAGNNVMAGVLSNESHIIPVTADGEVRSWVGAETTIYIYEGNEDVTSLWNITVSYGQGLVGSYNDETHTMTPSQLTTDTSYAEFLCRREGYSDIFKRYTITKQYAGNDGQDAVIYEVESDVFALNVNESGVYNPNKITFSAYTSVGADAVRSNYNGRFIIEESTDRKTFKPKYTSTTDENTTDYTPSNTDVTTIRCTLYQAGGTTIPLDVQTVVVTKDGKDGTPGISGDNGVSVVVTNSSDVVPCNTSGNAIAAKNINIPFYGFNGIQRAPITCVVGTLPNGVTVQSNTPGTESAGGLLILHVESGADFGDSDLMTGEITLTLSCMGITMEHKFTWTKNNQAATGESAILFQLYSTDGGMIQNGEGSTTIQTLMMYGTSPIEPSAFVWQKFEDGDYKTIDGETSSSLLVLPAMVDGTSWFKCIATYNGKQYEAYWTVLDQSDPVMAYTYSTVAQFKNSQGEGAIYTRVYRNGEEIDPIKSLVFTTSAPESASEGDFYYHLDRAQKTCTLKKYTSGSWNDATEKDELNYYYYRIDSQGVELDTGAPYKTGKCIYIDPSIIDGQMQFRCKVTD